MKKAYGITYLPTSKAWHIGEQKQLFSFFGLLFNMVVLVGFIGSWSLHPIYNKCQVNLRVGALRELHLV